MISAADAKRLQEIFHKILDEGFVASDNPDDVSYYWVQDGISIELNSRGVNLYRELRGRTLKLIDNDNDSDWLDEGLRRAITIAAIDPDSAGLVFRDILAIATVEASEQSVLLPVYGLDLEVDELTIGDIRITAPRVTATLLDQVLGPNWREHPAYRSLGELYTALPCAHVKQRGNKKGTRERAVAALYDVVNFIQFTSGAFRARTLVSSDPSSAYQWRAAILISEDVGRLEGYRTPIYFPYRLSAELIAILEERNIWQFEETYRADYAKTKYESTLQTAIYWFGNAMTQIRRENRLLSLIAALDGVFTERGGAIGRIAGEGAAFLLSADSNERRRIFAFVDDAYSVRNTLAHGGLAEVTEEDVSSLEQIVHNCITRLIGMRSCRDRPEGFTKPRNFQEWVFAERFGS